MNYVTLGFENLPYKFFFSINYQTARGSHGCNAATKVFLYNIMHIMYI
jgi:hypothetical protein